jgi:D5 N terminal like
MQPNRPHPVVSGCQYLKLGHLHAQPRSPVSRSQDVSRGMLQLRRLASAKTRAAVVALTGEDRRLAATIEQWNADPWLLNTPGGVVNLRSGTIQAHRPADYMTKITAVAPAAIDCPKWKGFLEKVTSNDLMAINHSPGDDLGSDDAALVLLAASLINLSSPTVGTSYSTYTLRCSGCSVGVTMTAGHFNDPEHWRQQADEARATARQLPNPDSKAVMMRIAVDYDRLAERARARADEGEQEEIEWLNAENPKQRKS